MAALCDRGVDAAARAYSGLGEVSVIAEVLEAALTDPRTGPPRFLVELQRAVGDAQPLARRAFEELLQLRGQ